MAATEQKAQHDNHGRLRHLLTLNDMPAEQMTALLDRATSYSRPPGYPPARSNALAGRTVANLFFEPSTRTRASFDLAGRRLGADVLNLDLRTSSRAKGESLLDTIYTLQAMQTDVFVVRDAQPGVPAYIADNVMPHVSVLNAGESTLAHPTQGLLDALTIRQSFPRFEKLRVTIIGDIVHSRVARSAVQALRILGCSDIRLVGPASMLPVADKAFAPAVSTVSLDEGLDGAHVVMALRIQKERMQASEIPDNREYFETYGLTEKRLQLADTRAIVMHPGPMNRDVEIAADVADGPRSVIERQVTNGVLVRMAVMATVMETIEQSR